MIKWTYFSKFLKLFWFGFLTSCFMVLGNSVNADTVETYWFIQVWWNYIESNLDTQFSNAVLKRWKLLSQYIWYTKPMFALSNYKLFFWNWNKPYLFDAYNLRCSGSSPLQVVQWYINKMVSCNEITTDWWDWSLSNDCSTDLIDYNEQLVSNFFQNVVASDWIYYYRSDSNDYYCRDFTYNYSFCYSSSQLHKTLCFVASHWYNSSWVWLWENLNFPSDTTYSTINLSVLGDPPGWWTSTPDTIYWSWQICPTVSQMLSQYDSKYTTWYCYVPVFESWTITNYFIEDIFSWFWEFQSMFSNYTTYCHAPYSEEYCNSMMWDNIVWKNLIAKLLNSPYDFDLKTLRNYCHLTTLPSNATSCTLQSWWVAEPATPDELLDIIVDMPSSLVTPWEDTIVSNVLWTWATDLSNVDIVDTLNWLYSRFTSFFTEQAWFPWTLPTYIITFLLVVVLFKLFKK